MALQAECFEAYRRRSTKELERLLDDRATTVRVIDGRRGEGLVALLILQASPQQPRHHHILALAASPRARGQGLGTRLLEAAVDMARAAGSSALLVDAEDQDPRLVEWYEANGFDRVAHLPDHFHEGCSAIRLQKPLA